MTAQAPRTPRRRMMRMAFWMGSLCLSLASVPTIIEKLDDKGVLDSAGLGGLADLKNMLGGGGATIPTEGEIAGALTELNAGGKIVSKKNAPPRVITPQGEMDEQDYRRLVSEAERLAPIALTRARLKRGEASPEAPAGASTDGLANADESTQPAIEPAPSDAGEPIPADGDPK